MFFCFFTTTYIQYYNVFSNIVLLCLHFQLILVIIRLSTRMTSIPITMRNLDQTKPVHWLDQRHVFFGYSLLDIPLNTRNTTNQSESWMQKRQEEKTMLFRKQCCSCRVKKGIFLKGIQCNPCLHEGQFIFSWKRI